MTASVPDPDPRAVRVRVDDDGLAIDLEEKKTSVPDILVEDRYHRQHVSFLIEEIPG
jgi:hypothetical protein